MSQPTTEWESVTAGSSAQSGTWRLRVEGGWIYSVRMMDEDSQALSSVFVPDYDADMERISDLSDLLELVSETLPEGKKNQKLADRIERELEVLVEKVTGRR